MTSTTKVFNRRHWIVPEEDTVLMSDQKPCVLKFWHQCWSADPYGSRWMKLATNLSDSAFRFARRVLEAMRLFIFRRVSSESDGRTSYWEVRNLHGARVKEFWQGEKSQVDATSNKRSTTPSHVDTTTNKPDTVVQTQPQQAFQEPSGTPQEHITNSSKELVMCVSSTSNETLQVEETAYAPLGGASPPIVEGVEEKEQDLPMATDCTTLALVDDTPSQLTPLLSENRDCSDEPKDRLEGTCSAASVVLAQSEIFDWLDKSDAGVCPPLDVIQYLLDGKYYTSMRASITKFGELWGVSVVNYQAQKIQNSTG